MYDIVTEDECNDSYGSMRMYEALQLKKSIGKEDFPHIPCERTVYPIMSGLGLIHTPKRKPNGLTTADTEAVKSDDKVKRDFRDSKPLEKCVTDITEVKMAEGKLYISVIEDCFDNTVLGLSSADMLIKWRTTSDAKKTALFMMSFFKGPHSIHHRNEHPQLHLYEENVSTNIDNIIMTPADFGNMTYGYIGRAAGFSEDILLSGDKYYISKGYVWFGISGQGYQ